jgi:outer membrane receptor protein involved in Fe transport
MALKRYALVSPIAAAVAMALSAGANAQEPEDEITVTGTRIQRTSGFATPVPVTTVTSADLESFKPGATVADQLDQLPQFFQTQSAQRGGGALFGGAGRSVVDLRAMGPQRTLILLDGMRLAPADRDGSVHIDNIPTALLSQIEVVTGGASAAYGADALAGVTNFVLNRNYTGLDVSVGLGQTADSMGENRSASIAYGGELSDRWHFIGSLERHEIDPIDYDPLELDGWFQRYGIVANPAWSAGNTSVPARLVLPNTHSTSHTPAGRIGVARNPAAAGPGNPTGVVPFSLSGPTGATLATRSGRNDFTFTDNGATVRAFNRAGTIQGTATGNQSGGTTVIDGMTEAERANRAFNGGPYGAEVIRNNFFAGFTFDVNDTTELSVNLLGGSTESNDYDQRGIPHMASPWTTQIFVDNAYLPANVRQAMIAEGVDNFVMEKQGQWLGQAGNYGDSEDRSNKYDTWTFQLGLDKDLGDNWQMEAHIQRGATDRFTKVHNEIRVDREMLAVDAVEVYTDRRDNNGDGLPDLVAEVDRGTGQIICNVQRYNPTPQQLQASVANVRVPAAQGDDSLGNGDPLAPVPIPSPVGPDAIPNCVPLNIFGQGNASQAAQDYVVSAKWGDSAVTQEFAEVLFTGDIYEGYGPGPFSMAVGATWREQWFWQRGQPQELMAYGPPLNVPSLGIRGIQGGFTTGSPNLHEFSTVPTIKGGYDVWELFTEFNLPLWQSDSGRRLELDVAGRHSDYSTSGGIDSYKTGISLQAFEFLRFRATSSRDVREPTFAERFDVQGGGGSIMELAVGGIPVPPGTTPTPPGASQTTFQITSTNLGNPLLEPEEADTLTAGIVVQPAQTGLQFSIDWYDIDVNGAIGQLGVQRIVNECNAGNTSLCQYVFRDPNTNAVTAVRNPFLNINNARVRGLDYELVWNTETDWFSNRPEVWTMRFLAGRLLEDSNTTPGGTPTDLSGQLNEPENRAVFNVRYQLGDFGVSLQQRYFGESELNVGAISFIQFEPGRVPGPGQSTIDDATVDAKSYTDLTLFYERELSNGNMWDVSLAITNLNDEDPPVIPSFDQRFSSQGNPANAYDVYGRRFLLGFRYRL